MEFNSFAAEKWLRTWSDKPDSNIWKYAAVYDLSKDFIREFRDNFHWNKNLKKQLLEMCGKKFYKEILGEEE